MASQLSEHLKHEVFMTIKQNFADFELFEQLVEPNLKIAIEESNDIEINYLSTKRVIERYYDVQSFRSSEQKNLLRTINVIFKSCYVLILYYRKMDEPLFLSKIEELQKDYPQFKGLEEVELELLLKFRNMLRIALMVIPAKKNKQILLKIVGRLEGEQKDYITGGGQTKAVNRRVEIYEQEGGVCAEKKVERSLSFDCIAGIRFKQRLDSDDDAATAISTGSSSISSGTSNKKRCSPTIMQGRAEKMSKLSTASEQDPKLIPFEDPELLLERDCILADICSDEFSTNNGSASDSLETSVHEESESSGAPAVSSHSCDADAPTQSASGNKDCRGISHVPTASYHMMNERGANSAAYSGVESSGEALEWVEFLNLPPFLRTKVLEVDSDPLLSDREVSAMVYCDYLSSNIAKPPPRVARSESHDEEFKIECSNLHTHS